MADLPVTARLISTCPHKKLPENSKVSWNVTKMYRLRALGVTKFRSVHQLSVKPYTKFHQNLIHGFSDEIRA